jgi:hypothetical protein
VISSCGFGLRPRFFFSGCGFGSGGNKFIILLISNGCNLGRSNSSLAPDNFRGGRVIASCAFFAFSFWRLSARASASFFLYSASPSVALAVVLCFATYSLFF